MVHGDTGPLVHVLVVEHVMTVAERGQTASVSRSFSLAFHRLLHKNLDLEDLEDPVRVLAGIASDDLAGTTITT